MSNAGSAADLKAVSQNLMHRSLFTTDEIHGILSENQTRERLAGLREKKSASTDDPALSTLVDQIAERVAEKLGR